MTVSGSFSFENTTTPHDTLNGKTSSKSCAGRSPNRVRHMQERHRSHRADKVPHIEIVAPCAHAGGRTPSAPSILILGRRASGKTTLARDVCRKLSFYEVGDNVTGAGRKQGVLEDV